MGIRALKDKDFLKANKYFIQNVESGFLDSRSFLNLALSYDLLKQPLKALEFYKIVSSNTDKTNAVFFSYFNQGELYGRLGDIEKALENYQSALGFRQKEKEIKTNIELLFKQQNQKGNKGSKNQEPEKNKKAEESGEGESTENKKGEQSSTAKDKQNNQSSNKKEKGGGEKDQSKSNQSEAEGNEARDQNQEKNDQAVEPQDQADNNQSEKIDKTALTKREQQAILEEVQKQENQVRTRFYQNRRTFGDKTRKDW